MPLQCRCRQSLMAVAITSLLIPFLSQAADLPEPTQTYTFSQPTESLSEALRDLAKRSGIQIMYRESDLGGLQAPALQGNFTVRSALEVLLRGTTLEVVSDGGAVVVRPKSSNSQNPRPSPSHPSDPPPAADTSSDLQEVVVTAERRSERLQQVPVSVTALGGEMLSDKRLTQPDDLQSLVPNLQAMTGLGPGVPVFALRGISLNDSAPNQAGPIGIYYDEVYKGSLALFPVGIYDLERMEVLRGPQGTLYGMNTTAGAINYVSKLPTFDSSGEISLGTGNYGLIEAGGFVNGALTDSIAGRLAFSYRYADGWFKNLAPGAPDMNSVHQLGIRGTVLFRFSDFWQMTLRAEIGRQTPHGLAYPLVPDSSAGVSFSDPYVQPGRSREIYQSDAESYKHTVDSISLENTWHLAGDLSLVSLTSYDHGTTQAPYVLQNPANLYYSAPAIGATANQETEDLRVASAGDAPLQYIVGAYFNHEEQTDGEIYTYTLPGTGDCDPATFASCNLINSFDQEKLSAALYTDAHYRLNEQVVLRAGLRFTHDEGNVHDYNAGYYNLDAVTPAALTIVNGRASETNNNLSWKAGVDYSFTADAMAYYTHSTGFRGSAFNFNAFNSLSEIQPSRPETIVSDEVGIKTQWFDRRVTLNGALFHYDYKNYVADDFLPTGITELYGIPDTKINGGELEWTVVPVRAFTLSGGLGVTDAKIKQGTLSGVNITGSQLPIASKVSVSSAAEWTVYDGDRGSLKLGADAVTFIGRRYFDLYDTAQIASGGYTLINAQAKFRTPDGRYGASLWGRNLGNRYYYAANYAYTGYGFDAPVLGDPRTYGISIDARF